MKLEIDDLGVCGIVVDDWAIEKSFKPKTITTDYSSWICYISRRAVPANTPITDTYYWKPITRLQSNISFDYNEFKDQVTREVNDFENQINIKFNNLRLLVESFLRSTEFGVALANEFGDNTFIGVNQKILTESLNKLWAKFEDITGEVLQGINMVVTPTFFISENGCDIHVSANTVETNGIFENIKFFINGELIHEESETEYVSFDYHIDNKDTYDYVVMCKAKIMGIEYTRQQIITRYNEFFIGAGSTYTDILDFAHSKQLNGTMRHNYDIEFNNGDKLIIVMGSTLRDGFIRADLNGVEIELTEQTVTIGSKQYVVLTSEPWSAGDYNIDINS